MSIKLKGLQKKKEKEGKKGMISSNLYIRFSTTIHKPSPHFLMLQIVY
jgi:hypothetical protein